MYRAMQIANYVVHLALKKRYDVTNLHLQEILYFLQAESLYRTKKPLFAENIEKWRLGPVIPEVHHEYKEYGSQPIAEVASEIIFDNETFDIKFVEFNEDDIEIETRERLKTSIITLLSKNPFELVDLTHGHTPWKRLRTRIEDGEKGLAYTNQELYEFFSKYPEELRKVLGGNS